MTMAKITVGIIMCAALVASASASASASRARRASEAMAVGAWDTADATFFGDMSGNATMGGDCGYGDLFAQGYGLNNTSVSTVLFNDGETCGACYEVQCINNSHCRPTSAVATVTSICPPDPTLPGGGLCQPPRKHFDMSMAMYMKISTSPDAGSIPIRFRRVPCVKKGGMMFQVKGNPYWILVLVYNVAGSGDVAKVSVKGSNSSDWVAMEREWGQNWHLYRTPELVGQGLSFQVTTGDGKMVQSDDVAPANWQFGQIFEGNQFET